jgi:dTMP kinase
VGFLLAIEGLDAAGKRTQSELLAARAEQTGLRVALLAFPRYGETVYSRSISDYLAGRFGGLEDVDPRFAALLFAGDRFESRGVLERERAGSDVLILDRYTFSNVAYQGARMPPQELPTFADWLRAIEHDVNGLPWPDLVLLLDVPLQVAVAGIASRACADPTRARDDIHERSHDYLARVQQVYSRLLAEVAAPPWVAIRCSDDGESLLPPQAIHERVWRAVAPALHAGRG